MKIGLGRIIILVDDYDKAWDFYERSFLCEKLFDTTSSDGQRFLHIRFPDDDETGIWFLKADRNNEHLIGAQAGGHPLMVLYAKDARELYDHLQRNGVRIASQLVSSPGSDYFHCLDLYGNKITVVELT